MKPFNSSTSLAVDRNTIRSESKHWIVRFIAWLEWNFILKGQVF